jgi:hypothetical protein
MGFSLADGILALLLVAAITLAVMLMVQIRRLRAGHEAFRRALDRTGTVLAAAESGVRDLSVHGSQMLVALDQAIAEAREIDRSLSFYVTEVKNMPWLPPMTAVYQSAAQQPVYPPAVPMTRAPPPPPAPAPPRHPMNHEPQTFAPAFVPRVAPEPPPPPQAVVETLADRLKARATRRAGGWSA